MTTGYNAPVRFWDVTSGEELFTNNNDFTVSIYENSLRIVSISLSACKPISL